ncbi:MAG: hypothetical protein H7Y15_05315 [Pseudonocardia sp.]|nr:hypothetical protein [Pseudonocardia sp.]
MTTVEIDPNVAGHARGALDRAGFGQVTAILADGTAGWAAGALITDTAGILRLREPASRSWASVDTRVGPPCPVEQAGERRLFDEVAQAYEWWMDSGSPTVPDRLVTVEPAGQQISIAKQATSTVTP